MSDITLYDATWVALKSTERKFIYSERRGRDSIGIFLTRNRGTEVLICYQPLVADYEHGYYGCPVTGCIDKEGENPEACAIREALEETGYAIDHADLLATYIVGTQTSEQVHLFTADVTGLTPGDDMKMELGEVGYNEWHPLEELLSQNCRYSGSIIGYTYLKKRAYEFK